MDLVDTLNVNTPECHERRAVIAGETTCPIIARAPKVESAATTPALYTATTTTQRQHQLNGQLPSTGVENSRDSADVVQFADKQDQVRPVLVPESLNVRVLAQNLKLFN